MEIASRPLRNSSLRAPTFLPEKKIPRKAARRIFISVGGRERRRDCFYFISNYSAKRVTDKTEPGAIRHPVVIVAQV